MRSDARRPVATGPAGVPQASAASGRRAPTAPDRAAPREGVVSSPPSRSGARSAASAAACASVFDLLVVQQLQPEARRQRQRHDEARQLQHQRLPRVQAPLHLVGRPDEVPAADAPPRFTPSRPHAVDGILRSRSRSNSSRNSSNTRRTSRFPRGHAQGSPEPPRVPAHASACAADAGPPGRPERPRPPRWRPPPDRERRRPARAADAAQPLENPPAPEMFSTEPGTSSSNQPVCAKPGAGATSKPAHTAMAAYLMVPPAAASVARRHGKVRNADADTTLERQTIPAAPDYFQTGRHGYRHGNFRPEDRHGNVLPTVPEAYRRRRPPHPPPPTGPRPQTLPLSGQSLGTSRPPSPRAPRPAPDHRRTGEPNGRNQLAANPCNHADPRDS